MIERLTRSLSFRLLAIFLVLAGAFVYFANIGIRWVYQEDDLRELISGHLSLHVDYVRRDIGDPPRIDRAIAITEQVPVDIRIVGQDVNWASDPAFPEIDELDFGASAIFSEDPDALLNSLEDVQFAVDGNHRFLKIDQGDFDIIVSSPRIRPTRAIREGAGKIGRGDFDYRIENYRRDQLGDLAADINKLADDVRSMLDAKRQLLLGISHELRSPLSRLRLALEFVDDSQKETLRPEIAEMEEIIASLLEAERLNTRHAPLHRSNVLVRELIEQLVDTYFEREARRIAIDVPAEGLEANVDHVRLALLVKNLLSNALRYSGDGGVRVHAARSGDLLEIAVEDHGPGLSAEQVANFGEPFYRGDPSRTRSTGGYGLGLYLAKLVAEAHGGTLSVDASYRDGARLVARLPG